MRAKWLLICWCLAALVGAAARATDLPDPRSPELRPDQRLQALIDRVRLEHSNLHTLEADFVQRKESGLLLEPAESHGVFSYSSPDRVRWDYLAPNPISLLISGEEMTTWYKDLGQAEHVQVGRQTQRILDYLGAGSSLETLLQYFDAQLAQPKDVTQPFRLELEPRFERVAKRTQGMTIWFDPEKFLPVGLRYIEGDGEVTEYEFRNLRVNAALPDDRFVLDIPKGVNVREVDLAHHAALR
jgi:outer membrane lipoprotein-sorting protein